MTKTIDNIKYFWADLPKWAKGIAIVAAIGIPSYIGYTIYKNKKDEEALKKALEEQKNLENDIDNDIRNGESLSYQESYYTNLADQLFTAFDGYGTDNKEVFNVFKKMQKNVDVKKLILAYNNKYINKPINSGKWNVLVDDYKGSLNGALTNELGIITEVYDDYKDCKYSFWSPKRGLDVINCILKANGLTYQF